ncbi:hypothetical protein Tco_1384065 [Tanacetum coccineum]
MDVIFLIFGDTTSIIDHHIGEVVFGKPFAGNIGLVYDQEEGTVTFKKDDVKITFKMPHKMKASNHINFKDINTDSISLFVLGSNDDRGKTYYSDSLTLGPKYKEDESLRKPSFVCIAVDMSRKTESHPTPTSRQKLELEVDSEENNLQNTHLSPKHTSESKNVASKSKTGQSNQENQHGSALDSNPSQPSASTPVVDEMHKEEQQAAGGPPSLGVTGEEGVGPQLI